MKQNSSDDQILKFLFRRADFEHDREPLGPGRCEVELQLVATVCWKCHQALVAVRGYRFADVFIALTDTSDTRTFAQHLDSHSVAPPSSSRTVTKKPQSPKDKAV